MIDIYMRNDLDMPTGKIAAQAAHALMKYWLDFFTYLGEKDGRAICKMNPAAYEIYKEEKGKMPKLHMSSLDKVLSFEQQDQCAAPVSYIVDSGRTVFNEPTLTCAAVGHKSLGGQQVEANKRLPFNAAKLSAKQGFVVNRKCEKLTYVSLAESTACAAMAFLDSLMVDVSGECHLELKVGSIEHQWLTGGFGKTVVGCKKIGKYNKTLKELSEISDPKVFCKEITAYGNQSVCFVFGPMLSDELQQYTRRFNLLNNI